MFFVYILNHEKTGYLFFQYPRICCVHLSDVPMGSIYSQVSFRFNFLISLYVCVFLLKRVLQSKMDLQFSPVVRDADVYIYVTIIFLNRFNIDLLIALDCTTNSMQKEIYNKNNFISEQTR